MKFNIRRTLWNRDGLICLAWAAIQQIVVAASTYLIVEATQKVTSGNFHQAIWYISGFALSLVIVYLPNTISLIYLQKWRLRSFAQYISVFANRNKGHATHAHDRDKSKHEPWITNEGLVIYDQASNIIYQIFSIILSSIFNVLVIAIILDMKILIWYAVGAVVLALSNWYFSNKIKAAALDLQNSRNHLSQSLLRAWDNILVGNAHNLTNWFKFFENRLSQMESSSVKYDFVRSGISSLTVSVAIVLVGFGNAHFIWSHQTNLPLITALFVTFPRQLQIIQNIFAFFNTYLGWSGVQQQLTRLGEIIDLSEKDRGVEAFIQMKQIRISKDQQILTEIAATGDFQGLLSKAENGRYTIRGSNGSGKSTLMAWSKELLRDKAFYLPSRFSDLLFDNERTQSGSDGQRLLAAFAELSRLEGVDYILLDEWDANLDAENTTKISDVIDQLSVNHRVFEIRHRGL